MADLELYLLESIAWGRPLVAVQRLDRGSQEHRFGSNAILCWRLGYNDPLSVN